VTDVGQKQHFDIFFQCKRRVAPRCFPFTVVFLQAARMAGWLPDPSEKRFPKTRQVGFDLVLGSDGKRFQTRSIEVVLFVELLDEAKSRSTSELLQWLTENDKLDYFGTLSLSFR